MTPESGPEGQKSTRESSVEFTSERQLERARAVVPVGAPQRQCHAFFGLVGHRARVVGLAGSPRDEDVVHGSTVPIAAPEHGLGAFPSPDEGLAPPPSEPDVGADGLLGGPGDQGVFSLGIDLGEVSAAQVAFVSGSVVTERVGTEEMPAIVSHGLTGWEIDTRGKRRSAQSFSFVAAWRRGIDRVEGLRISGLLARRRLQTRRIQCGGTAQATENGPEGRTGSMPL